MSKKFGPGMAFDMEKLNKVFAFLSVLLLITVVWVFLDDYIRPWKVVQVEAMKIKKAKVEKELKSAEEALNKKKLEELQQDLIVAEKIVQTRTGEISSTESELKSIARDIKNETIVNGTLNSKVAAAVFNYGNAHSHHSSNTHTLYQEMKHYKSLFAESSDRFKNLKSSEKRLKEKLQKLNEEILSAKKELKNLTSKRDLLSKAKDSLETNGIFVLRNLPLIDYLDPSLKIQQLVLNDVTDDRYFRQVPKVDRCITCHTLIDRPGFEDQKNPHKTHPRLDLMVGADSKHPMKKVGCTICHGGEGQRVTDFNSIAHMPSSEKQKKEWIEKYNWHPPHHIASPMLKLRNTEGSCLKCHQGVEHIPGAVALNEGRRNIEKFGCYACHKIKGWEEKRKPGPSLEKIASKIDKNFFKSWVWSPKSFNSHAKMPTFFNQQNNKREDFQIKNMAEVNSIAEYVWEKSKSFTPHLKYSKGNPSKGKALIQNVGCMACHGVEGIEGDSNRIDAYTGPYLTGLGSKLDPNWLVSWLVKPQHYQPSTVMPSFRLSKTEADDIAAYLLSLKNKKFENLVFSAMNRDARDEILLTYFSAFDTLEVAKERLSKMSDRERTLELGHRSIGKYGCYSCHQIQGFDGRTPIGPELSYIGTKPLTQFGFSHEYDVEVSRDGWINAHLLNPRRWDNGVDKPFKDLLRMPNFNMTPEQARSITTALLGHVNEKIPLTGVKRLDSREVIVAEGEKVLNHFNCMGCHQVDGLRGDILKKEEYQDDISAGPPRLVEEGHRVRADWLHHFFDNVYPIRPWIKVRMPSFNMTNDQRNKIVAMFQAKANQVTFEDDTQWKTWMPGEREGALKLFKSLDCTSCHAKGFSNQEATAPDLHQVKRRLRPSWIKKWLSNPQKILEGTVMPSFWENGESLDQEVFGGDPEKQMNALVKYLLEIGNDDFVSVNK